MSAGIVTVNYTHEDLPHVLDKISGNNLMRNANLKKPINQRGASSYASDGYCIDGYVLHNSDCAINAGESITITGDGTNGYIAQSLEDFELYKDRTVTFSVRVTGGTGVGSGACIGIFDGVGQTSAYIDATGIVKVTRTISASATLVFPLIVPSGVKTVIIDAVCCEEGLVSTLANGNLKSNSEENSVCKYFYRLWTTEAARTEALKEVGLMRLSSPTTGTIVIGGVTYYYASADL